MPGNLYDGHTLAETLEQVVILAVRKPTTAIVDKCYRRVEIEGLGILCSGQKRSIARTLEAMIHRRSATETSIGHMMTNGRLARNPLNGALGDALHAVMCGAHHNLRSILAKLRLVCAQRDIALNELLAAWTASTCLYLRVNTCNLDCSAQTI
jgi:IS5 family transposase